MRCLSCGMRILTQQEAEQMDADDPQSHVYQCPHNEAYWHVLALPKQMTTAAEIAHGDGCEAAP